MHCHLDHFQFSSPSSLTWKSMSSQSRTLMAPPLLMQLWTQSLSGQPSHYFRLKSRFNESSVGKFWPGVMKKLFTLYIFSFAEILNPMFTCMKQQGDTARRVCCKQEEGRERPHTTSGLVARSQPAFFLHI